MLLLRVELGIHHEHLLIYVLKCSIFLNVWRGCRKDVLGDSGLAPQGTNVRCIWQ